MKAIVFHQYGSTDVLNLEDVAKPIPADNEILIKIVAASINDWDWQLLQGIPFVNRIMAGIIKPTKIKILGCDMAGRIEAVGKNIKLFKKGDEVFGDTSECGFGGFAEYICVPENILSLKPASMTFEQAASLPQAGLLALQGLINKGQIKSGQKVLINGASGGTGSFAVQIAKSLGAEVSGVCSSKKMEFVRSLGADHVIDYSHEDYTKKGQFYDLILDVMGFHSIFDTMHALSSSGRYVMAGGATARIMQTLFIGSLISLFTKKKIGLLLHKANKDMAVLINYFESGKISPVIDKCFPLEKAADAMHYFAAGVKKGKVIITMED